ncbi:hypothetical protein [Paenibacillus sp. FSL H8-0537]|uniref:hypothetical protein n=1 Tax=Paenibacillus sp. FSL H8-0537 TaxID=2921399 RepID=UPI0031015F5E
MLAKQTRIVELDVRPYLRQKLEPFQLIMDQVKELETHDVLVLHAPAAWLDEGKGLRQ